MPFRRYSRPRKFSRRPRRFYRRRPKVSNKVKSYVKRTIHRNVENKDWIYYVNQQSVTVNASAAPIGLPLIPNPSQGTTDGCRIGNKIRMVKGIVKGHVHSLPYNASTNPGAVLVRVKIWIARSLQITGQYTSTAGYPNWTTFFKLNNSQVGFQANMLDQSLPCNDNEWKWEMVKQFTIGTYQPTTNNSAGFNNNMGYNDGATHSCLPFYFDYSRFCKKVIKFDDTTGAPTNANLYLLITADYVDGSTTDTRTPCAMDAVVITKFEDA